MDIEQFKKERDEAFHSLDKQKILAYCSKYGVPIPHNEIVFWSGIHKAIYALNTSTPEQKAKSKQWLEEHGFHTEINYFN